MGSRSSRLRRLRSSTVTGRDRRDLSPDFRDWEAANYSINSSMGNASSLAPEDVLDDLAEMFPQGEAEEEDEQLQPLPEEEEVSEELEEEDSSTAARLKRFAESAQYATPEGDELNSNSDEKSNNHNNNHNNLLLPPQIFPILRPGDEDSLWYCPFVPNGLFEGDGCVPYGQRSVAEFIWREYGVSEKEWELWN